MRRRLEVSWHKTTKTRDLMATVNDAAVQRKCMLLSGGEKQRFEREGRMP